MKKVFAKVFALALCSLLCFSASALELESVESAQENVSAGEETALQSEVTYPSEHETYGTLIYYNDFSSFNSATDATYLNTDFLGDIQFKLFANGNGTTHTGAVVNDPADVNNKVYKVTYADSPYSRVELEPTKKLNIQGNYTVVFDVNVSELTTVNFQTMFYYGSKENDRAYSEHTKTASPSWIRDAASATVTFSPNNGRYYKNIYIINSSGDTGTFYVDNVRVYYKKVINADRGDLPSGVAVNVINKGGYSTKSFSNPYVVPSEMYELPEVYAYGYAFQGWVDEDGNKYPVGTTPDKQVYATWKKSAPGLNMLTGTRAKATLEDGDRQYIAANNPNFTNTPITLTENDIKDTVTGNTSNTVLKATGTTQSGTFLNGAGNVVKKGNYISWLIPVQTEAGRKYTVTWDAHTNDAYKGMMGWLLNVTKTNGNVSLNGNNLYSSATGNKWVTEKYSFEAKAANGISLQYKLEDEGDSAKVVNYDLYFDNIAVYPNYKVTYHYTDGTTESIWTLNEDDAEDIYTPDKFDTDATAESSAFLGWSTEKNAKTAMTTVELKNEDIDLYPVWADLFDTYYINASKTKTYTLTVPFTSASIVSSTADGTTLSYDAAAKTITIKGGNYAGEILVKITLADSSVAYKNVYLSGGASWKPGLNIITGTTEGFFVGNKTTAEVKTAINYDKWHIDTNPITNGVNANTYVLRAEAKWEYIYPAQNYNPLIERERPYVFSYDVLSSDTLYTMINHAGVGVYASNKGKSVDKWMHEALTINLSKDKVQNQKDLETHAKDGTYYIATGGTGGEFDAYGTAGKRYLYMDNFSVMPYYKATYVKLDGSTESDYFLFDASGKIMTTYTPNAETLGTSRYSLTVGGAPIAATTPVKLNNADITLYAVDPTVPGISDETSVRTGTNSGIRFSATVDAAANENVSEFGFIVARKDTMDKKNATEDDLKVGTSGVTESTTAENNFQGQTDKGFAFVGARNYKKDADLDKYNVEDDGTYSYSGVVVGLEKSYKSYDTDTDGNRLTYTTRYDVVFAARPYVVISGNYFYGGVTTSSMQKVAQAIQNDETANDTDKAFAQSVLDNIKKTAE